MKKCPFYRLPGQFVLSKGMIWSTNRGYASPASRPTKQSLKEASSLSTNSFKSMDYHFRLSDDIPFNTIASGIFYNKLQSDNVAGTAS